VLLLAVSAGFAQTRLRITDGAGVQGGKAALQIVLETPPPSQVAGLQWTLKYPKQTFRTAIIASARNAAQAGKSVQCNDTGGAVICVVSGVNSNTIESGAVATVTLAIAPSAPVGPAAVSLERTLGATVDAKSVAVTGTAAKVAIAEAGR
jgi:hypothetical protein